MQGCILKIDTRECRLVTCQEKNFQFILNRRLDRLHTLTKEALSVSEMDPQVSIT
jgi:hypothetical protein